MGWGGNWGNNTTPRWGSIGLNKTPATKNASGSGYSKTAWGKGGLSNSKWGSSWGSENTFNKMLSVCTAGRKRGIWG